MTRRHVLSQALTGLTSWKFIVTNNMTHAPWHPTVVDGRVNFPTHAEAAYPDDLCNRIASMLKQRSSFLHMVQLRLQIWKLSGEKSWQKPQQSCQLGAYLLLAVESMQNLWFLNFVYINAGASTTTKTAGFMIFYTSCRKGAAIQSRLLSTWGEVREAVERLDKKENAWKIKLRSS